MAATILKDFHDAARFQPERFAPVSVGETERMRVVLTCFEPGQFIPVHSPAVDMALVVLEGEGTVVAGEEEARVGPGALIVVPAGQSRGVHAATRLVAVHVVSPPPREQDHAQVQSGLQRGTWR